VTIKEFIVYPRASVPARDLSVRCTFDKIKAARCGVRFRPPRHPHGGRADLGPEHKIHVIAPDIGGFGSKVGAYSGYTARL
jgi:hypothetical protein